MASRSSTLAVGRSRLALTALAAVLGLGIAAIPMAAGAAVSGPASSAANGAAAARQAAASAGQRDAAHPRANRAELTMLAERAKLAARSHGAGAAATKTGTITGTVLGADSRTGACVTAVGSSGGVTVTAAPGGTFAIAGLAVGRYALEYRDCAAAGRYLPAWSGGVAWHSAAALVQVAANQISHVPVMILKPSHAQTVQSGAVRFSRALAASNHTMTAAAAATTGRISGRVTGNGKPLGGICVLAFPVRNGQVYGATTAANGTYSVRHVAPGRYLVAFAGFGCPTSGNWLPQLYPNDNNPFAGFGQNGGTPVAVTSGHATRGIDAHLRLGGEISGTVTGPAGRKLGGVCVNVLGTVPGGQIGFSAATSAKGTYQLHALFPGKYSVQFAIGCGVGGNYAPATHRPVKIGFGTDVSGVNEKLSPGASVTGKVTLGSSSGQPLAGMCVFASNADGSVSVQTQTGPHGNYRVIGLAGGNYQLQIGPGCNNNGNYTTVNLSASTTAGKQTSGVNAVLQPGATISGTVTDRKGRPVPNMCIELNESSASSSGGFSSFGGSATAADGSYVVNQLSAGTYEIGFATGCGNSANYAPYWYNNQSDQSQATPIVLATGASQTVNAKLRPGAAIAGTVTDASGHGLAGICVSAATEFQAQIGPVFTALGQTGTHGRYTISGLAPGQYLIDFGCGQDPRYADQWFAGAASAGSADLVSAPVGRTAGINAVLQPAGSIGGVVTGNSGRPLAGVCVSTVNTKDISAQPPGLFVGGNQPVTDSHGVYVVTGLAAGSYDVLFQPCTGSSRYAEQWFRRHGSTSFQTAVHVQSGKRTSGINARLTIGGTISGHVFGAAGKPLRNVCVFAFDAVTSFSGFASTGRAGAYTIPALASATYQLEFLPCGNQNLIPVLSSAKVTAPHAVTGVNATLRPGGSVSGTVTVAGSGSPAPEVCVEIVSSDPSNLGGFALTNPDGTYQATGLPTGVYQVFFADPTCFFVAGGFVPQWYNNQPTQATANPVSVTAGHSTPSIDAVLQPGAVAAQTGQITGTVTSPASAPLAGICVTAVPSSADLVGSPPIVAVSRTGDYRLIGLTPGQYTVEFSAGCGASGYVPQWWQDASSLAAATPVSVGSGQVVSGISAKMST